MSAERTGLVNLTGMEPHTVETLLEREDWHFYRPKPSVSVVITEDGRYELQFLEDHWWVMYDLQEERVVGFMPHPLVAEGFLKRLRLRPVLFERQPIQKD